MVFGPLEEASMKSVCFVVATAFALLISQSAAGHGGGLDRNGCHTNRKTGDYHCHSAPSLAPAPRSSAPRGSGEPSPTPPIRRASSQRILIEPASTSPDRDLVRTAQILLQALGYRPSMLGSLDERTRSAVRAFQRARNLEANGVIDESLVLRLAREAVAKCP